MSETHWKKLTNPNYLGTYALTPGQDMILTIGRVAKEIVVGADGKSEECIVCHWKEDEKPMILNVTNCKTIARLLKTPYIENWAGHRIQIGSELVSAFGEKVDALRVRKSLPKDERIACDACGKNLVPAYGMSVSELAKYTKSKYGKTICAECAKKEAGKNESDT